MIKYLLIIMLFAVSAFSSDEAAYISQAGPDGVQRVEVTAGSYFFKPEHIIVKAGVPVELVIRNEAALVPHNFVMKSPEAGMDINEALSETLTIIRFTPARPGRYPFYCDKKLFFFKSHRERGMEGVLEVR